MTEELRYGNFEFGLYTAIFTGAIALATVAFFLYRVLSSPESNENTEKRTDHEHITDIAKNIRIGSKAFLRTEYMCLCVFVIVIAVFICLSPLLDPKHDIDYGWKMAICFIVGSSLSGVAGYLGMYTAVQANVRTTTAATLGLNHALRLAFKSGAVMGLTVVSFGILGVAIMLAIMKNPAILAGFGFGASSIALFARVGGGIFTKAADVGADLCGKLELGLDEDDPSNPAVIADNVGDNVGDVAGMGADLFESYVGSIIACLTLAKAKAGDNDKLLTAYTIMPFIIAGGGILCSIIGTFFVSVEDPHGKFDRMKMMNKLLWALRRGLIISSVLVVCLACAACFILEGNGNWKAVNGAEVFGCIVIGLVAGMIIGFATEYCTSFEYFPTRSIADAGHDGHAPVIIQGLGVGMISTIVPVVTVVLAILACTALSDLYGVAIAGVGMLSTLGITLATDAYGPVADNAGGIAEMGGLDKDVRDTTDALDALGNTTAATGKGFAIGSAVLTAVALMASFIFTSKIGDAEINIMDNVVMPGVLIGALLPSVFAALTMLSVRRGASAIMAEVDRQFKNKKLLEDDNKEWTPEHDKCVKIATTSAIVEMILPGSMAVLVPLIVGFALGAKALVGLLVGAISSGFLLAVTMANAGGAWDNAKKYVEAGNFGGKKSPVHQATVTGDTVGDPFKDTSGPSLNILIKLMSVVSLVFAPVFSVEPYTLTGLSVALVIFLVLVALCTLVLCCCQSSDERAESRRTQYEELS